MLALDLVDQPLHIGSYVHIVNLNVRGIVTRAVFTKKGTRIAVQYGAYPAQFYHAFRHADNKKGFNVVFIRET